MTTAQFGTRSASGADQTLAPVIKRSWTTAPILIAPRSLRHDRQATPRISASIASMWLSASATRRRPLSKLPQSNRSPASPYRSSNVCNSWVTVRRNHSGDSLGLGTRRGRECRQQLRLPLAQVTLHQHILLDWTALYRHLPGGLVVSHGRLPPKRLATCGSFTRRSSAWRETLAGRRPMSN